MQTLVLTHKGYNKYYKTEVTMLSCLSACYFKRHLNFPKPQLILIKRQDKDPFLKFLNFHDQKHPIYEV